MLKKFLAAFATVLVAAGLSLVAVATPASAHHSDISGVAVCAPSGGYDITWTVINSENKTAVVDVTNKQDVVPKDTPFDKNPQYGKAGSIKNTFTQHVFNNTAQTLELTLKWSTGEKHTDHFTVDSFPTGCGTPTNAVDCSVVKLDEGRTLNNSDHINMDIVQDGKKFQINIDIDDVQAQDKIVSESGLLVRVKVDGVEKLVRAVTNQEKNTGIISISYSTYLSGTWTVEWVQFSDTGRYFNQNRTEANFIKCGTDLPNAAASVTLVPPTCNVDGSLTLNTTTFADWGTAPTGTGAYSVVATAKAGHTFPADNTPGQAITNNGKTKTFTGTILPKSDQASDCDKYEVAIYLYQKKVPTDPASWENSLKQTFIASHKGTAWFTGFPTDLPDYVCGPAWGVQQDKVANWEAKWDNNGNFTWPTNIEYPTDNIGWPPIYDAMHQNLTTIITVPPCATPTGEPSFQYLDCQAGSKNQVTLPAVDGGVWEVTQNGVTTKYATFTGTLPGYDEYSIVLKDKDPLDKYDVKTTEPWKYTAVNAENLKCATTEDPTWAEQLCNPEGVGFTTASYTIKPVEGIRYEISFDNGQTFKDATPPGNTAVTTNVLTFPTKVIIKAYPLDGWELVGTSEFSHEFLASTDNCLDKDASVTIAYIPPTCFVPGAIDPTGTVLTNANWKSAIPTVPGDYTLTANANPGHAFSDGTTQKQFPVTILPIKPGSECYVLPTYTQTPLSCTAAGSYTLAGLPTDSVDWSINGAPVTTGGTYKVTTAQEVQLVASPHDPTKVLNPAWTYNNTDKILTLKFVAATVGCDLPTLAFTGAGVSMIPTLFALLFVFIGLALFLAHRRFIAKR